MVLKRKLPEFLMLMAKLRLVYVYTYYLGAYLRNNELQSWFKLIKSGSSAHEIRILWNLLHKHDSTIPIVWLQHDNTFTPLPWHTRHPKGIESQNQCVKPVFYNLSHLTLESYIFFSLKTDTHVKSEALVSTHTVTRRQNADERNL